MAILHYTATVRPDRSLELPPEFRSQLKPGQQIEIGLDWDDAPAAVPPAPNLKALAALDEIAKRQEGRPYTDGSDTLRLIHEARDGGMYGYEPTE